MRQNCYALRTFLVVSYAFREVVLVVMHAGCDGQGNLTWLSGIIGEKNEMYCSETSFARRNS
jgi:hypothetical protein